MPEQTIIDYTALTADDLSCEIAALREDLERARQRVAQIEHDIARAEEELKK